MSVERISLGDATLIGGYAENIQRYAFARPHCLGKRVLDAGCGSGYGACYLADNGAKFVFGVDNSYEAIDEAKAVYKRDNLHYDICDIESSDNAISGDRFDVVVNFENIAHLNHPDQMMTLLSQLLSEGSTFIVSTPNGQTSSVDESGKPRYKFQHRAYSADELESFLSFYFGRVTMYGQWLTHSGVLRRIRAKELFDQICESYYNPMNRVGRAMGRLMGRTATAPPQFTAAADSFPGDHVIRHLNSNPYPWAPRTLLALCEK